MSAPVGHFEDRLQQVAVATLGASIQLLKLGKKRSKGDLMFHHHHHLFIAALITIALVSTVIVTRSGKHQSTGYPAFSSQGNGPVVFTVK